MPRAVAGHRPPGSYRDWENQAVSGFKVGKLGDENFVFSRIMSLIKQVKFQVQVHV